MAEIHATQSKSSFPVILDFVPTSSVMRMAEAASGGGSTTLSFALQPERHDEIDTAEGRSLLSAGWSIEIYCGPTTNEHVLALGAIGMLNHFSAREDELDPTEEECMLWAHVSEEKFKLLWELAQAGRVPRGIRLQVRGHIKYGWAPDGSVKVWDIKKDRNLAIEKLDVWYAENESAEDEQISDEISALASPTASTDAILIKLLEATQQLRSEIKWVIAIVAFGVAMVAFR